MNKKNGVTTKLYTKIRAKIKQKRTYMKKIGQPLDQSIMHTLQEYFEYFIKIFLVFNMNDQISIALITGVGRWCTLIEYNCNLPKIYDLILQF